MSQVNLDSSWLEVLKEEFEKPYFKEIKSFLESETKAWKTIYPNLKNIFNALENTNFENVKVVILWQDPYHWANQAHGLSFSVQDWVTPPPSLKNIYKEIENDIWVEKNYKNGNLTSWTKQWVLLLNSILTVEASKPASHSKIWWQNFTDEIIKQISDKRKGVVFLLWGSFAKQKKELIDTSKHHVLESVHPSPFSAHNWFFWCQHFSKANEILEGEWKEKIKW